MSLSEPIDYSSVICGVAIFDVNGLPREYFTTPESQNMDWVQTVFQSLGLKSLLMSSLQVEGFRAVTIRMQTHCAVVFKLRDQYVALLIQQAEWDVPATEYDTFLLWLDDFERHQLRHHERFILV